MSSLFHLINGTPRGQSIEPSIYQYYDQLPSRILLELGIENSRPPLLFAATHKSLSLSFGMRTENHGPVINMMVPNSDSHVHLCGERPDLLTRAHPATLFSFARTGFVEFKEEEGFFRQCVGIRGVPFSKAKIEAEINSPKDLMHGGLQILAFKGPWKELVMFQSEYGQRAISMQCESMNFFYERLNAWTRLGKVVWKNAELGINPDPHVASLLLC